jgi:sugar lactone lactonase YvrE
VTGAGNSLSGAAELRKVEVEDLSRPSFGPVFGMDAVISPDGTQLYAIGTSAGSPDGVILQRYARASDGSLTPIEDVTVFDILSSFRLSLALSPDGDHLYAGLGSDRLETFARDASTGALYRVDGPADISANLVVSPDGRNVYATYPSLLATYARDPASGLLTRIDLENGVEGPAPINGAAGLAVSPDGRHVYLGSTGPWIPSEGGPGPALIVFARDETSGTLEFVEAMFHGVNGIEGLSLPTKVAVSPDGGNVYASGSVDGGADDVAMFARDAASGTLAYLGKATGAGFTGDYDDAMAISPDGERVVVTGKDLGPCCNRDGVSIFARDPDTGLLTHLEHLIRGPAPEESGLAYPTSVSFSPDGRSLYVIGAADHALTVYRVLPHCSAEPLDGCEVPMHPGGSQIVLTHGARDALLWKWRSGEATRIEDLGDPRSTTDYAFCLHRETAGAWSNVLQLRLPAGSTCGDADEPCWRAVDGTARATGYVFKDRGLEHDGVNELRLRLGGDGRPSIHLDGRGPTLDLPALPLGPAEQVVAQLRTGDGACWSADYAAPALRDDVKRFVDRD